MSAGLPVAAVLWFTPPSAMDCNLPFSYSPAGGRHQLWLCRQPVCGPDLPVGQQQRLVLLPQLHRHRPEHLRPASDQPVRHDHAPDAGRAEQHLWAAHAGQRLIHMHEPQRGRCAHLPCMFASMYHTQRRASSYAQHPGHSASWACSTWGPALPQWPACKCIFCCTFLPTPCWDPLYPARHPGLQGPWAVHLISGYI